MDEAVLVIEDEPKIARLLEIELQYEGYRVGKAGSGTEGLEKYAGGQWDLILLDIMLPGLSGIEVLRRIRAKDASIPILLLTAKDSVEDKVSGLDLGANDYITKPFRIEELLARVRAALRLSAAAHRRRFLRWADRMRGKRRSGVRCRNGGAGERMVICGRPEAERRNP